MFLTGIALLTPLGLAGAAVYVIGHGLVKGALFLCTGIVLHRLGSVAGALILAGLALYWRRLPLLRASRPNASIAAAARRFQSGVVNDYVTWIVIGLACLGGIFAAMAGLPRRADSRILSTGGS
jgi:formate hydrogenlyase subunit 3/multisubunit Na+/H+ antiporter MnhD subunit